VDNRAFGRTVRLVGLTGNLNILNKVLTCLSKSYVAIPFGFMVDCIGFFDLFADLAETGLPGSNKKYTGTKKQKKNKSKVENETTI